MTNIVGRVVAGVAVGASLLTSMGAHAARSTAPLTGVIVRATSADHAADAIEAVGGSVTFPLPIMNGAAGTIPADAFGDVRARNGIIEVLADAPIHFQQVALHADPVDADARVSGAPMRATVTAPSAHLRSPSSAPAPTVHDNGNDDSPWPRSVFAEEIRADRLWEEGITGAGVRVALIDTGVSAVPDLAGRVARVPSPSDPSGQADCVDFSGERSCQDSYGHGTFVAGLIAGSGAASDGVYKGIAPGAQIVSVKIAGRDGSADVSKVLAAIQWVVSFREQLNIRVLNLSLGTNSPFSYRHDPLNFAVEQAWRSGIAVVVSASNRGPDTGTISKPADDPLVITTGAIDDRATPGAFDDRLPDFSGRGPTRGDALAKPDLTAPGARVISLRSPGSFIEEKAPGGGIDATYRRGSGTSMSAGVVSGAVALAFEANPSWTPDRVKFALMSTARPVATQDRNAVGAGLINVRRAAREAPAGLANTDVFVLSDGYGTLEQSRGDVKVTSFCSDPLERTTMPARCDVVQGAETAQGRMFDAEEYREADWTGSSWYESQWNFLLGSSWYGSSWYGSSWYGSSWYGSSWYGYEEDQTNYGMALLGSSWYGAWE